MKKKVANAPAVAKSQLSEGDAVTVVCMAPTCNVTYEFDTSATNANLKLRYVVSIDGKVLPSKGDMPRVLDSSRKFTVAAHPGNTVALFLNSDSHPNYRSHPVYAVKVGENEVRIKITEQKGRTTRLFAVLGEPEVRRDADSGKDIDTYTALLTGDIWMDISHIYTEEEVAAILPKDTEEPVRDAVLSIFRGLPKKELEIKFPKTATAPALKLKVRFQDSDNANKNTTYCPLLGSVLTRTHPLAFAALFSEAHAAEVTEIHVTSAWRPMHGTIVHRAGLGLDICFAQSATDSVQINREALTKNELKPDTNVSKQERELFAKYEKAKGEAAQCRAELLRAKKSVSVNKDQEEAPRLKLIMNEAAAKEASAIKAEEAANRSWNEERNLNERGLIRTLRGKLAHNKAVDQVLDPWYLDINTKDDIPALPNEQKSENETTHDNHLHITIADAKLS